MGYGGGGSYSPPLGEFGWGSLPHGIFLLLWRDLALLAPLFFIWPARNLVGGFVLVLAGGFWAAFLGALWALASTTPPFLWAGDGVELATSGGLLCFLLWAHSWPKVSHDFYFLGVGFPCLLLVLQGLGVWTFHHDLVFFVASNSTFGAECLPLGPKELWVPLSPSFFWAPFALVTGFLCWAKQRAPVPPKRDNLVSIL